MTPESKSVHGRNFLYLLFNLISSRFVKRLVKMPYVYIGKKNFYVGKTLWEIVGNLKNFGAGRILVRSKFEKLYPEVTYFRILRAEPLMDEVKYYWIFN